MAEEIDPRWQKFERDGILLVRRKLEQGLYRPERAKWAQAWLEHKAQKAAAGIFGKAKTKRKKIVGKSRRRALSGLRVFLSYHHTDKRLA